MHTTVSADGMQAVGWCFDPALEPTLEGSRKSPWDRTFRNQTEHSFGRKHNMTCSGSEALWDHCVPQQNIISTTSIFQRQGPPLRKRTWVDRGTRDRTLIPPHKVWSAGHCGGSIHATPRHRHKKQRGKKSYLAFWAGWNDA